MVLIALMSLLCDRRKGFKAGLPYGAPSFDLATPTRTLSRPTKKHLIEISVPLLVSYRALHDSHHPHGKHTVSSDIKEKFNNETKGAMYK